MCSSAVMGKCCPGATFHASCVKHAHGNMCTNSNAQSISIPAPHIHGSCMLNYIVETAMHHARFASFPAAWGTGGGGAREGRKEKQEKTLLQNQNVFP